MTHSDRKTDAFTLMELIVVITIISVLASMVVPFAHQSLKEWQVNRFSRSVLTAHQAARFHAITTNRHIQVRYNIPADELNFFQCKDINDKGNCEGWSRFWKMSILRPSSDSVDLWSVGKDNTVNEACMYFKPSGQVFEPVDRSDTLAASSEDCTGDSLGSGVHITWYPNPKSPTHTDKSNHCKWNTIYIIGQSGSPAMLEYGAYPTSKGPFRNTLGDPPPCAR